MIEALLIALTWLGLMAVLWGLNLNPAVTDILVVVVTTSCVFFLIQQALSAIRERELKRAVAAKKRSQPAPAPAPESNDNEKPSPSPAREIGVPPQEPLQAELLASASAEHPEVVPVQVNTVAIEAPTASRPWTPTIGIRSIPENLPSMTDRESRPAPQVQTYGVDEIESLGRQAPVASASHVDLPSPTAPVGPPASPFKRTADNTKEEGHQRQPRKSRPILEPADFTRNAEQPGFLYLARNPEHWLGLHKIGQTIHHPSRRVGELNKQHAKYSDIGSFALLDVVSVVDAYGAEQVLFKVLEEMRPVLGREFIIAHQSFLSDTMRAVADFVRGENDWLNQICQDLELTDHPPWPPRPVRHNFYGVAKPPGWVYLARNRYHLENTYRFGASKELPEKALQTLNTKQKEATSQIGFYTVVFALPVWNTNLSRTEGWRSLAQWRLAGTRSFVRGPLDELAVALTDGLQEKSVPS